MTDPFDNRIKQWRKSLAMRHGLIVRELDELEDHLRADLAKRAEQAPTEEAPDLFQLAIERLGTQADLARELRKGRRSSYKGMLTGWAVLFGLLMASPLALDGRSINAAVLFWDTNAVLMVIGIVTAGLLLTYRPRQIGLAMKLGVGRIPPTDLDQLIEAQGVLRRGRQLGWACIPIAACVGAVFSLSNWGDYPLFGSCLTLLIIGSLTGIASAELFFASQLQFLQDRRDQIEHAALA